MLAERSGLDSAHVGKLLLVNDRVMAHMQDVTPKSCAYATKREIENASVAMLREGMPKEILTESDLLFAEYLLAEYQEEKSPTMVIAFEADKLDTLSRRGPIPKSWTRRLAQFSGAVPEVLAEKFRTE